MIRSRPRRRKAGFSLVELLVILAIVGLLLTIAVPALLKQISRSQLVAATRETASLLQRARMEAIRRGSPVVVEIDATGRGLRGFVDSQRDAAGLVTDLAFNPAAGEIEIGSVHLGAPVELRGPGDAAALGEEANLFDLTPPGPPEAAPSPPFVADLDVETAVFMPNGSVLVEGAFRFADAAGRNFLEVRVEPRGTGRIAVRKYNPTGMQWNESGLRAGTGPGTGRNLWEWY